MGRDTRDITICTDEVGGPTRKDTYYPSGMHSSCRSSPFNTTFFV